MFITTKFYMSSCSLDRPTLPRHWICSCQPLKSGHSTGPWWSNTSAQAGYVMTTTTTTSVAYVIQAA